MKVLNFSTTQNAQTITSFQNETSEVITVNFRKKEITKMVETDNVTGMVRSSYEMIEKPTPFMGGAFGEMIDLLLKKKA